MSSTRQDTMQPAREGLRELLRRQVKAQYPGLPEDEVEEHALTLDSAIRARGGRRSAASRRAELRRLTLSVGRVGEAAEQAEILLTLLREAANPCTTCLHDWPGDLDEDPYCQRCGLPYAEYSQDAA